MAKVGGLLAGAQAASATLATATRAAASVPDERGFTGPDKAAPILYRGRRALSEASGPGPHRLASRAGLAEHGGQEPPGVGLGGGHDVLWRACGDHPAP